MAQLVTIKLVVMADDGVDVEIMTDYIMQSSDMATTRFFDDHNMDFKVVGAGHDEIITLEEEPTP